MAPDSGEIWHRNPFPRSPVVRLGPSSDLGDAAVQGADSGNAHIDTPLVADLEGLVDDYFAPPAAGGRRGLAVALVGGFGLGKSHALRRAYQKVRTDRPEAAMWTVDEPAQDMGRLYRDRLRGPTDLPQGRQAFEELVRDYYAYVTAGWVGAQEDDPRRTALQDIAAGLRDRTLDPDKVVSALRYDPEVIHADLRGTLGEVTEHRGFATALALLLEPPFKPMVWQWLRGGEPAEPLRERGVTEPIGPAADRADTVAGIDRVFDALAVQGFLHGRVGRPYVLLMDSLEKVLDWREELRRTFMDAFERLVNIYTSHGGLLVFCTSTDGLRALRPSVHERMVQLWANGLDEDRTRQLVARYLAAGEPAADAARPATGPFDEEGLRLVYGLAEGVPRRVLRICREAWQISEDDDGLVRAVPGATVLTAARRLHERVTYEQVLSDVHDALDLGQWRIASRDPVPVRLSRSANKREEVMYWLSPAPNSYLAVIYARSLLLADDAERVTALVHGLRSAVSPGRFEALLVVNGLVSQAMQDRLWRSIGSRPLVYRQTGFPQSVHEALLHLAQRLVTERRDGDLVELGEQLRRDLDQQTARLEELSRAMAALALEPRPGTPATATVLPPVSRGAGGEFGEELPGPVGRRFRDALVMLEGVTRQAADRAVARRSATSSAELSVFGCATLVQALTEKFRSSVAVWSAATADTAPTERQLGELRRICREYERAVEVLPVHLLDDTDQAHAPAPAGTVEGLAEEVWGTLSATAAA
ncbi:hypothetical protein ACFZDK_05910 [Streptomyces sp. NPDC007901]|uniref:hypothetical protein n=1 Tax=Streptomyces sp. NPDC007901 TaxID=3364785 RepID=UPI0036EA19C4